MKIKLQRVNYKVLNPKQQENYNFQKVSAILADYGFTTIRLSDDWNGADFIAQHINGNTFLKVQLKGRLSFDKKYIGRNIHICFSYDSNWYIYPHDELLKKILKLTKISKTVSWSKRNGYSFPRTPKELKATLELYRIK